MPAQTYRSPNFYDREIDQSAPSQQQPVGTPAGVIGTSNRGPAFVPVTVGNFDQYEAIFGGLDPKMFGPYAAAVFLANRSALTFIRVLGAGSNDSTTDISQTSLAGTVLNAGFKLPGSQSVSDQITVTDAGGVQFIVAQHTLTSNEAFGEPIFTDNDSFTGSTVNIVRGVVMMASGARMFVADGDKHLNPASDEDLGEVVNGKFKILIKSALGNGFYNNDGNPGYRILTASMDPSSTDYFAKVLNTDPDKFVDEQHLLYSDFAVDAELAVATSVAVLSGSDDVSENSGDQTRSYRECFGSFDTRFRAPSTTHFISQPFGTTEYDLFKIEALDDGTYANNLYKVSITNIKASLDDSNKYGTFTIQIRSWNDTDTNPLVLEQFNNCTLDPSSENYVARVIGDRKVFFNFDAPDPEERRIVATGRYENRSAYVRVVMNEQVERGVIPENALPFGFRGIVSLKTNNALNQLPGSNGDRLVANISGSALSMTSSLVPPVPFRTKVTKGSRPTTADWLGQPGITELPVPLYYWGVKFERNNLPLDANIQSLPNNLLRSLAQFQGIEKLDTVLTGAGADIQNNNKFTLSKVALSNGSINDLTASVDTHMREAAYIRNGKVDTTQYTINDPTIGNRITLATILGKASPAVFNRFSQYAKFTTFLAGGWDGVNILDKDARRMNDYACSFEGAADANYVSDGFLTNQNGNGQQNSTVSSYVTAINIMTDPMSVNHNILLIPGIREPFITDYAGQQVKNYGLAYYVMDIEKRDETGGRLFDSSTTKPDVNMTATSLDTRAIDNNYVGTYFPDVYIDDSTNRRKVKVPASIAALGALGFNDRIGYPWFAPAGFNRAALDFVTNVDVRLTSADRDRLSDSRINPIATFPRQGFVIFGQKTLQIKKSAFDRVNVRRLMLEVKRIIVDIALRLGFENNTPEVWNRFVSQAVLQLGLIKAQSGIESFNVIMNETNNTSVDRELNRLNGKVVVVPTRVIEVIAVDFIITKNGVQFV